MSDIYPKADMDQVLTNLSIQYKNNGYVARELFPLVTVKYSSGKYRKYSKPDRFTIPNTRIGPKGNVPEVEWTHEEATYKCDDNGLMEFIPQDDIDMAADPLDPERDTTEMLTDLILGNFELAVKAALNALPAGQKATPTTKWNAATPGNPFTDINAAKASMFVDPNVMIVSADAYNSLINNEYVLDRIKYTSAEIPAQILARVFEVDRLIVARAKYNTGTKASATYSNVWSKMVALAYVAPTVSLRTVTFGATMTTFPDLTRVFKWAENARGAKGGLNVKVSAQYDVETMCSDCGFLLSDVIG